MAETTYTYSETGDTLNGVVDLFVLKGEVEGSGSINETLIGVFQDEDTIRIVFQNALPGGEKTALDNLVAAHNGVGYVSKDYGESVDEYSTADETFQQAHRFTTALLQAGDYIVTWSAHIKTNSEYSITLRVDVDDTTVVAETGSMSSEFITVTGFSKVTLTAGTHTIDFDIKAGGALTTVSIKNMIYWISEA